jgi:TIR domain
MQAQSSRNTAKKKKSVSKRSLSEVFLSHKQDYTKQAQALCRALRKIVPGAAIFRSEDIDKGADFRAAINRELAEAKCFVLLYTDPEIDWSWCFYEAGVFMCKGRKRRPVFCLHPKAVPPPSPLANLQSIPAERAEIEKWIRNDFSRVLTRKHREDKLKGTVKDIEKLVNATAPVEELFLKPYIEIRPQWSGDWNAIDKIPQIDFSNASVKIDLTSANQLGFDAPPKLTLLPFLRRIACDNIEEPGKVEFWIKKFFESLQSAVRGSLNFQEAAYFRHENGKIYRPVVASHAKNSSGTKCILYVIFASAFGSPLTDSPGLEQRLSIGARLAVRTRLEVIDPFLGRTSRLYREKVLSRRPEDEVSRKNPVGARMLEALDAIWQEALSHGLRPDEPAPVLFEGSDQRSYEELRNRGMEIWDRLKDVATREDQKGTGEYPETEQLLMDLKHLTQDYLALVLPRIEELFIPAEKRRTRPSPALRRGPTADRPLIVERVAGEDALRE